MVSAKPYFSKILELIIVSDHLRNQMAVIVNDRHFLSTFVVQLTGIIICEHEIVIDERLFLHQTVNF